MASLGQRIKDLRKQARLSQEVLAEKMGKSGKQIVSNWELDKAEPSVTDLRKLATLLNTTLGQLLTGDESFPSTEVPPGKVLMDANEVIAMQRELLELKKKSAESQ